MRRRLLGALAAFLLVGVTLNVSASAASPSPSPTAGSAPATTAGHGPPSTVLGLNVVKEDISKDLKSETQPLYVDKVGLYSYRDPSKQLEATLEIAHFRSSAPSTSTDFQATIVSGLSASAPIVVRVNGYPVYITTIKGLTVAVWFKSGYMLALSIRNTFVKPKELLRDSLGIVP